MAQLRQCQSGPTDESWLRIEAGRLSFYESSGPVRAVVARGNAEIAVIVELSGEGSSWLEPLRLRLDSTGQRLEVESVGVEGSMGRIAARTLEVPRARRCPLLPEMGGDGVEQDHALLTPIQPDLESQPHHSVSSAM